MEPFNPELEEKILRYRRIGGKPSNDGRSVVNLLW